jgi:uracil-DNA glycosylase
MLDVALQEPHDLGAFRGVARSLVAAGIPPPKVIWHEGDEEGLFSTPFLPTGAPLAVPTNFAELAKDVICHRERERLALLYEALWRILQGERSLLQVATDPLVHRLEVLRKAIGRDIHKMQAFVRFRRVESEGSERYVAWFEPEHFILDRVAPFFTERFPSMCWSILTPKGALHWDGSALSFGGPVSRADAPSADALDDWWRTYYRATFNPGRVNPEMMRAEMPKRYWRNLPEATIIPELISEARNRTAAMLEATPKMPRKRIPKSGLLELDLEARIPSVGSNTTIAALREEAAGCTRCHLYKYATQTVFGEGPEDARIVMVGEQPGDQEDLQGRPFVGPAGKLLDRALDEAGIDRSEVYVTNAVKHFKFEPRGKRRIHKKPDRPEIEACKWWLERELAVLKPELIVALGGTAGQALYGRFVKVLSERGIISDDPRGFRLLLTIHPSMILRMPEEDKQKAFKDFVRDLRKAA